MKSFKIYIVALILGVTACKERYTPDTTSINSNILVVEGFINTGADSTFIKLSRTVTLANKKVPNPEIGATITVETSTNETKVLVEKEKGLYVAPALNFGSNKQYRLKIRTKNGANYQSDFVVAKASPQIDSVNYVVKGEGLQLYVNASDPTNKTQYYRWEYDETWIFYAQYNSQLRWTGTDVVDRTPGEGIYQCWGNANSSTIVLGSSVKLSKDVIHLAPLTEVVGSSEKLSERYSILVKQYALTKEAYEFWENLKKNTETLGSIFDVLPSQLTGNIRNTGNTAEPVIGYISAGSVQRKRIFISKNQLPYWSTIPRYVCGPLDTIKNRTQAFNLQGLIPVSAERNDQGAIVLLLGSTRECADCTIRGTARRPSFWQ